MTKEQLLLAIDQAIVRAGEYMNLDDLEDPTEDEYDEAFEDRFHCGVCVTRSVLDIVWPSIENYINHYKND